MGELPSTRSRRGEPAYEPLGGHAFALTGGLGPDGGDLIYLRIHGVVELEDLKLILALLQRVAEQHQHVYVIANTVGPGGFAPEARRYYVNWRKNQSNNNRWVYVIGASILVRTLVALVLRGTTLITGQVPTIHLVTDEAEALKLIAARRAQSG